MDTNERLSVNNLYTTTNVVAFYSLSPSDGERVGERGTLPRLLTLCIVGNFNSCLFVSIRGSNDSQPSTIN